MTLTAAAHRLRELRARSCACLATGAAFAAAAAALWAVTGRGAPSAVTLLAGAGAAVAIALLARGERRRLLLILVAQGDAGAIHEVRAFADVLCTPRERARLADALLAAANAGRTGAQSAIMVDPARAEEFGDRLRALANALIAPSVRVSASAIAICRRLLSEAAISPLYNPRLPSRELRRVLELVEREVTGSNGGPAQLVGSSTRYSAVPLGPRPGTGREPPGSCGCDVPVAPRRARSLSG